MKRIFLLCFLTLFIYKSNSQELPSKKEIINVMKSVNNYWISQNPVPGNNQWARAAYFTGNLDFYKIYPKKSYIDYAKLWATNNNWALNGGNSTRNADNQTCGQVYIDLYNLDSIKDNTKISSIKASIDNMVKSQKSDDWWWVDALYMSMPVFARLGAIYNDASYFDKMYQLYTNPKVTRGLYNTTENLWYRDESYKPPYLTPNGQDSYWARGNGWAFAAHARILQQLPESNVNRNEYIETFRAMAEALKNRQQTNGFWYVSLDDSTDYPGPETSGTSFFTYGLAWGINNGILDSTTYYPVVARAWNALVSTSVKSSGFLGYVQGVGSSPASSQPVTSSSTADFGVGAFLLAGSEVVKLAIGEMPVPVDFNVNSVKAINKSRINVSFNKKIDKTTALNKDNYIITNDIVVNEIAVDSNDSIVILSVSDMIPGVYSIEVKSVLSSDGGLIEEGENKKFIFTGIAGITASGFESGTSNTPDKTMDFDLNTRWSADGTGQWILYDLGELKLVHSVEMAFYNGTSRLMYFSMSLSEDGEIFTEVYNGSSSGKTVELEMFDFDDLKARYVKVIGYGNSQSTWNSITETRINYSDISSSINLLNDDDKLNFYPQPFTGTEITLSKIQNENSEWRILDISGKIIYSGILNQGSKNIILNKPLQSGSYILSLKNNVSKNLLLIAK